mmetsp:Transcript_6220/g.9009  ORF Transcript_6220/g.9009 Transcript_6220/m.9009 type:complete len:256 (+) Transcript_6220:47-814(+)
MSSLRFFLKAATSIAPRVGAAATRQNAQLSISSSVKIQFPCVSPLAVCRNIRCMSTNNSNVTTDDEITAEKSAETKSEEEAKTDSEEKNMEEKADDAEEKLQSEIKDLKDQLLRSLAEQENTRRIARKDIDSARNFAVTSFAKSLLDTSDNLSRALDSVPEEFREDHENHKVLANLYEGIKMTDDNLTKAFAKHGLKKYGAVSEKFDPNLHDALFEYPDTTGELEPGTLGQVMKKGFMLNDRVIRPAEVGVIKKT